MREDRIQEPKVIWFRAVNTHHAFVVFPDGSVDAESCCGKSLNDEWADEPARELSEFDTAPACAPCLAVAELKVPAIA